MKIKFNDAFWSDASKSLLFRILLLVFTIINVSLMVSYLGDSIYGSWITISSIVTWMNAGDFGIGNGLRNEISKYKANEDYDSICKSARLTSKSFFLISIISLFVFMLVVLVLLKFRFIKSDYIFPLLVIALFFSIGLYMSRYQSIAMGLQKSWYVSLAYMIGMIISIITYSSLMLIGIGPSLIACSILYGIVTLIPFWIIYYLLNKRDFHFDYHSPNVNDKLLSSGIVKTGLKFYSLQLTSLILLSTDNFLIDYLLGSEEVTRYSLINQIYTVGASLFCVLLDSFWSGVAIHYEKKDMKWIVSTLKKLLLLIIGFSFGVFAVSKFLNEIVSLWLGRDDVVYDNIIIGVFALYCIFYCIQSIFGNMNYAINKLNMIRVLAVISAILNIPLSIYFVRSLEYGIMGIKLGTFVSLAPSWFMIIVVTFFNIVSEYKKQTSEV